jgi:hypothetical protein
MQAKIREKELQKFTNL